VQPAIAAAPGALGALPPRVSAPSAEFHGYSFQGANLQPARVPSPLHAAEGPARAIDNVSVSGAAGIAHQVVRYEYIYGTLGLLLGLACILGGVMLGLRGVTGSTSWTAELLGLSSNINDATPGVVLFVVGVFLVWITKPSLKFRNG
jgi:hypothetical protein